MLVQEVCEVCWLGAQGYAKIWQLQDKLAAEIAAGRRPATLLLLEHPHTYTIGRCGGMDHLLWDQAEPTARGVDVIQVDRGGDVTYHSPGQLVGHPIVPLAKPGWQGERLPQADYVGYLRSPEKMLIFTMMKYGIPSAQRMGLSGVWVLAEVYGRCSRCDPRLHPEPGKIASIGVRIDAKGVAKHGFALNVHPDMTYWEGIIACGLDGVQMLFMGDLAYEPPSVEGDASEITWQFGEVFHYNIHWEFAQEGLLPR